MKQAVLATGSTGWLVEAGAANLVVAPEGWCGAVKTDKCHARELCLRREHYQEGNTGTWQPEPPEH